MKIYTKHIEIYTKANSQLPHLLCELSMSRDLETIDRINKKLWNLDECISDEIDEETQKIYKKHEYDL